MLTKFTIFFAVLFTTAFSKMYWECDNLGKYRCSQEQTCCRSKVSSFGWSCFPGKQGVCCSDGASFCPFGTICDVPNRTCRKPTLSFLEAATEPLISAPSVEVTPQNAADFGLGLLQGVQIFDAAYKNSTCVANTTDIFFDVLYIIQTVNQITSENVFEKLRQIVDLSEALLNLTRSTSELCLETVNAVQEVLLKVREAVSQPEYLSELATHSVFNLQTIKDLGTGAVTNLQQGNYSVAGNLVGQAVKFGFLWRL